MNTKFKSLVVAVALAASGAANAAIDAPVTGNGELFFNIWDPTVGKEFSFTMGLNTNMNTFVTSGLNAGTVNFGNIFSNATYTTLFNDPADGGHTLSNLRWNVVASSSTGNEDDRVMITQALASSPVYTNGQAQSGNVAVANFLGQAPFSNVADNEGGTSAPGSSLFVANPLGFNGETLQGNFFSTATSVGSDLGFYMYSNTGSYDTGEAANAFEFKVGSNYGTWNLSNSGELTYSVGPVVPVPAAVWLLGSALVGLVGVSRRRETTAA